MRLLALVWRSSHRIQSIFLQGVQVTSVRNQRLAPVEYGGNKNSFVEHQFSISPEVFIIEHSISQFPEGCAGTAYNYSVEFLFQWRPSGIDSLSTGNVQQLLGLFQIF